MCCKKRSNDTFPTKAGQFKMGLIQELSNITKIYKKILAYKYQYEIAKNDETWKTRFPLAY